MVLPSINDTIDTRTHSAAGNQLDKQAQTRLLLRKLDQKSHTKYVNYILPKTTKDFNFKTTVDKLKQILSFQTTVFSYNCLTTRKHDNDDFITYAGIVNRNCKDFKFTELGPEQFRCLIFISGLQATKDFEIRARLLRKLETHSAENPVTLHDLVNECQRVMTLKMDTALVEKPTQSTVNKIERKK
ncbi:gag-pol polyprotein [Lasius niger]|uniref:Tpa: gag-pol polyprotein n=1 Tax=Lasius niger TaxID=67767 RepID=A0A0J7K069_LASNI|nr:gag-pol polyprotein [Lasius niger]